ncbi:MAG TPA: hypothetical protein VF017_23710 [Thermoanaerobaculia bacterium]|nr:hypothetical protein [Thermoanaerobaculia bacterium]
MVELLDYRLPSRQFYVEMSSYMAVVGSRAFWIHWDSDRVELRSTHLKPGIFDQPLTIERLVRLTTDWVPELTPNPARPFWAMVTSFYQAKEKSSGNTALFAWGGKLVLLERAFAPSTGRTSWSLQALDGEGKRIENSLRLPSEAPNLTVIPGEVWAFLEGGATEGTNPQEAPYIRNGNVYTVGHRALMQALLRPQGGSNVLDCSRTLRDENPNGIAP